MTTPSRAPADGAPNDDGGPAFPHQDSGDTGTRPGMSVRDYFAGQALAGMLANEEATDGVRWDLIADNAYCAADAMLAARKAGAAK